MMNHVVNPHSYLVPIFYDCTCVKTEKTILMRFEEVNVQFNSISFLAIVEKKQLKASVGESENFSLKYLWFHVSLNNTTNMVKKACRLLDIIADQRFQIQLKFSSIILYRRKPSLLLLPNSELFSESNQQDFFSRNSLLIPFALVNRIKPLLKTALKTSD